MGNFSELMQRIRDSSVGVTPPPPSAQSMIVTSGIATGRDRGGGLEKAIARGPAVGLAAAPGRPPQMYMLSHSPAAIPMPVPIPDPARCSKAWAWR